jgi:peroxiredoxin Q/BCP
MAEFVSEGQMAPDFTLASDDGTTVRLSALRGKPVVLYFYPKDDTPGCTIQACAFRDRKAAFAKEDATVLGVSFDNLASHAKFRKKHELNFPLLADDDKAVATKYGVYREKKLYGRTSMGIVRSTFLIGPDGRVARAWTGVRVAGHDEAVAAALAELRGDSGATGTAGKARRKPKTAGPDKTQKAATKTAPKKQVGAKAGPKKKTAAKATPAAKATAKPKKKKKAARKRTS